MGDGRGQSKRGDETATAKADVGLEGERKGDGFLLFFLVSLVRSLCWKCFLWCSMYWDAKTVFGFGAREGSFWTDLLVTRYDLSSKVTN